MGYKDRRLNNFTLIKFTQIFEEYLKMKMKLNESCTNICLMKIYVRSQRHAFQQNTDNSCVKKEARDIKERKTNDSLK